jgi:hypothetical protein
MQAWEMLLIDVSFSIAPDPSIPYFEIGNAIPLPIHQVIL